MITGGSSAAGRRSGIRNKINLIAKLLLLSTNGVLNYRNVRREGPRDNLRLSSLHEPFHFALFYSPQAGIQEQAAHA